MVLLNNKILMMYSEHKFKCGTKFWSVIIILNVDSTEIHSELGDSNTSVYSIF